MATAYVAMLAIWLIYVFGLYSSDPAALPSAPVRWSLLVLPVVMAVIAHLPPLSRLVRAVPDRGGPTLVWPVVFVVVLLKQLPDLHISVPVGVVVAGLLAVVALGWRSAKGMQDARMYGQPGGRPGAQPPGRPGAVPRPGGQAGPAAPLPVPWAANARATGRARRASRRRTRTARRATSSRPRRRGRSRRSPSTTRWRSSTR